jgi:hypothetical protein
LAAHVVGLWLVAIHIVCEIREESIIVFQEAKLARNFVLNAVRRWGVLVACIAAMLVVFCPAAVRDQKVAWLLF